MTVTDFLGQSIRDFRWRLRQYPDEAHLSHHDFGEFLLDCYVVAGLSPSPKGKIKYMSALVLERGDLADGELVLVSYNRPDHTRRYYMPIETESV